MRWICYMISRNPPRWILVDFLTNDSCRSGVPQAVYGSIVGTLLDSSGAIVAGAKIMIRNLEQDVVNNRTTNESGNYSRAKRASQGRKR